MNDPALERWRERCEKELADGYGQHFDDEGITFAKIRAAGAETADEALGVLARTPWAEVLSCEEEGFRLALRWLREEMERGE